MTFLVWLLAAAGLLGQEPQQQSCAPCHNEQIADFQSHKHSQKGLQCSVCHGTSQKHRESTGNVPPDRVAAPDEVAALCGTCHQQEKTEFLQSKHQAAMVSRKARSANCNTCHGHHALRAWKATEAGCNRCHTELPAACKRPAATSSAKVSCMNCHARHTLVTAARP